MSPRFGEPSLRAKDADRNRAVDLIDAAFSDGQLTAPERELRSQRAMGAATLGELETLTRDLQEVHSPELALPRPGRRRLRTAAIVVAVLAAGAAGVAALRSGPDPAPPAPAAPAPAVSIPQIEPEVEPQIEPQVEPEIEPEVEPEAESEPGYALTRRGMRHFIRAHQEEFGAPKALAFGFARHQVVIYRPSSEPGMVHRWFFRDGRFLDDGPESPTGSVGSVEVDLREVNLKRLFANLRDAKRSSGLTRFTSLGATILHEDGADQIYLVAADRSTCWAMHTDFAGTVRERGIECYGG